jgi:hypothetical protein
VVVWAGCIGYGATRLPPLHLQLYFHAPKTTAPFVVELARQQQASHGNSCCCQVLPVQPRVVADFERHTIHLASSRMIFQDPCVCNRRCSVLPSHVSKETQVVCCVRCLLGSRCSSVLQARAFCMCSGWCCLAVQGKPFTGQVLSNMWLRGSGCGERVCRVQQHTSGTLQHTCCLMVVQLGCHHGTLGAEV